MTYWPISSPSVFAATKETRSQPTPVSHDGADDATDSSAADSEERTESETSEKSEAGDGIEDKGTEEQSQSQPQPQLQQPKENGQGAEDDITGEILAIKVTRSGHMFATITRSTLTIWQTKARLQTYAPAQFAD